jgi:cysteine-rich repeat protein
MKARMFVWTIIFVALAALAFAAPLCQYANSASATSQNSPGSAAAYAIGAPNAPSSGECSSWSGTGYTWNPTNWNVKANLTLAYITPVYASNFTVYGDYDICWDRAWLKNSATAQTLQVFNGWMGTCVYQQQSTANFLADTLILQTCGWAWSSTDAAQLCGTPVSSAVCGNNILESAEQCDNGTQNGVMCTAAYGRNCTYCTSLCAIANITGPYCGDTIVNGPEQCDDGNKISGDGCSSTCLTESNQTAVCGNSIIETGEQCDRGAQNGIACNATYAGSCTYCTSSCLNSTITGPYCGDHIVNGNEQCDDGNKITGDGCSTQCLSEPQGKIIYVVPYIGDIDGGLTPTWTVFFNQLVDFHDINKIPAGFSFYPATITTANPFRDAFLRMYNSRYIELIQKGNAGDENESNMDKLSYAQQYAIIKAGQDNFRTKITEMTGNNSVRMPLAYNQFHGRFTETTRAAAEANGLKMYLELFLEDDLLPVASTETFDITEYGVSFSIGGNPGYEAIYDTPDNLVNKVKNFSLSSVEILTINGSQVIPIWAHQQDFMSTALDDTVNMTKWNIYRETLLRLKNDSQIILVSPTQIYQLRHKTFCGNSIVEAGEECDDGSIINGDGCSATCKSEAIQAELCQYATSASATSQNSPGSSAVYATGTPNAPSSGECNSWSGSGYTWSPTSWNVKSNLTLTYATPIFVSNFTAYGDYDICWNRAWLKNSATGQTLQVMNGIDTSCILKKQATTNFLADTLILETCGWSWSSTDAAMICGMRNSTPTNNTNQTPSQPGNVSICTWKNCKKGAVSVSVDDYYNSCMQELEAVGYRGTYFLTETSTYDQATWNMFNSAFLKGHEIGTHTQGHLCSSVTSSAFIADMNSNINDIKSHTAATSSDIITHAYACGYVSSTMKNALKANWNFLSARGYYFNLLENSTPTDYFNLKSYNSIGYPGGKWDPPAYTTLLSNTEAQGKWLNMVFHNECSDEASISTLPSRNLWVDTIGNVIRYTKLRDNAKITNYLATGSMISFSVTTNMTSAIYKQNLTMQAGVIKQPSSVKVNGNAIPFTYASSTGKVTFDFPFPVNGNVVITQ